MILHNSKHGFWHHAHASMLRSWVTPEVRISLFDILLDLLQPIYPILGLQVDLWLLKMVSNDSFITQNMGFDTRAISIECSEADNTKLEFHFLKSSLTSYSPSTLFLTFWSIWGFWKWSKMILHDQKRRTMSLAHSEAKLLPQLQFHFLKSSLTSYSPSAAFLTFRLIWGFWKWSPVIPHNPKHGVWHQNHVCSMLRSWVIPQVRIPLLEVLLDLLQSLHPVLDLQINLRFFKMVSNDSPYPKSLG